MNRYLLCSFGHWKYIYRWVDWDLINWMNSTTF